MKVRLVTLWQYKVYRQVRESMQRAVAHAVSDLIVEHSRVLSTLSVYETYGGMCI